MSQFKEINDLTFGNIKKYAFHINLVPGTKCKCDEKARYDQSWSNTHKYIRKLVQDAYNGGGYVSK